MEQLKKIALKIDSLSLRERGIVFLAIIMVIYTAWDSVLMGPLEIEQKTVITDISKKNAERLILVTGLQESMKQNAIDPDKESLIKLKSLRSKLIDIQADLESSTANLVTPNDMPKILETVLHKTGGLTLNNLRSLGVTPLVSKVLDEGDTGLSLPSDLDENNLTADNLDNAYKHGIRIEFTGDYLTTLEYLKSLEELEWGFFWDSFELNVNDYPEAKSSVEIFTLSLREEWIGV